MKHLITLILTLFVGFILCGCSQKSVKQELSQEQKDSINKAKEDSVKKATLKKKQNDSILSVLAAEKKEKIKKLNGHFRYRKDEFEETTWVYSLSAPRYTNINSVHLYFQQDGNGHASNLRFRIQYTADDWLFIQNVIFNIDGQNYNFIPTEFERDNDSRIWEWCDEPATNDMALVNAIANAKSVKMKFNGEQYYDTRKMSSKELQAFKETLEFYKLLGGSTY